MEYSHALLNDRGVLENASLGNFVFVQTSHSVPTQTKAAKMSPGDSLTGSLLYQGLPSTETLLCGTGLYSVSIKR